MRKIRLKTVKGKRGTQKSVNSRIRELNLQRSLHRIRLCASTPRRSGRLLNSQNLSCAYLPPRIRNGDEDGLQVAMIPHKGRGVIATRHFYAGEPVVEYIGERLSRAAGLLREDKMPAEYGSFLFYYYHKGKGYCVDASSESIQRLGRLVNHSRKNPNCHVKKIEDNDGSVHLVLYALKQIEPFQEVTYCYGETRRHVIQQYPWLASS